MVFFLPLKGSGLAIGDHGVFHVSYSLNSLKGIIQGIRKGEHCQAY